MKTKKLLALILAVLTMASSFALLAYAEDDSVTLDEIVKEADGWSPTPVLKLDSASTEVSPARIYFKNTASTLRVLAEAPQSAEITVKSIKLLVNYAPDTCTGKGADNANGNFLEASVNADGSDNGYVYAEGGAYEAGSAFAYNASNVTVKNETTLWTLDITLPLTDAIAEALKIGSADVKLDAEITYVKGSAEVKAYSTTANASGFDASGKNGVTLALTPFYDKMLKNAIDWIEASRADADYEALYGLTVNVIGDSYLAGQEKYMIPLVWPALLAKKYNWNYTNYAENGKMLSAYNDEAITMGGVPTVEKYKEMADNDADLIIFNGGKNDYNNSTPIGTPGTDDPTTFMGAMTTIIRGLKEKYPNATIIYSSVWNFPGTKNSNTYETFANAAALICMLEGVYMFEAHNPVVSGVDMADADFQTQYCLTPTDVSHLNLEGMKLVAPKYEAFIANAIAPEVEVTPSAPSTNNNSNNTDTTAPEADEPEEETTADTTAETTPTEEKKGCGSSIAAPAIILASVCAAGTVACRRRRKND